MNEREGHGLLLYANKAKVFLGVLFLLCGGAIYLLFRSKTLYIYVWCKALGMGTLVDSLRHFVLDWDVSDFFKFSLPDGLYSAAYLLIIDAVWHGYYQWQKYLFIAVIPVVTIGSELLQYFSLVKGTFDVYDLICYLIPPIIYIYYTDVQLKN